MLMENNMPANDKNLIKMVAKLASIIILGTLVLGSCTEKYENARVRRMEKKQQKNEHVRIVYTPKTSKRMCYAVGMVNSVIIMTVYALCKD